MKLSKVSCNLSVLAMLLATAFFACSSAQSGKLQTSAPLGLSGTVVILQADGGAPPPPPPPPPPQN